MMRSQKMKPAFPDQRPGPCDDRSHSVGGHEVYGGQHSSTDHGSSHPDRQQCVDNVDEEDRPPDAL
ncbi:hypothetical protein EYF80_006786 [Liparis tanakae]|uniref:Uncharacterized protein n=1 Tax=Liparis tanakae TaxID=230148 RepID=A0A4Z2IXX1_9TELE|nr:hypothetical protein EYF80_006786 [Liparis tanakae]